MNTKSGYQVRFWMYGPAVGPRRSPVFDTIEECDAYAEAHSAVKQYHGECIRIIAGTGRQQWEIVKHYGEPYSYNGRVIATHT